eukprot:scaffold3667_cov180-Amphora_coffeaeformis.AAC.2
MNKRGGDETRISKGAITAVTARDSSVIEDPAPGDVILGRGSAHAWRPGNSFLHNLVDHFQAQYHGSSDRKTKANIINIIYGNMKESGRFLRKIRGTDYYEEVPEKTVREKIAHTLRDRRQNTAPFSPDSRSSSVSHTRASSSGFSSSGLSSLSQELKRPPRTAGANTVPAAPHSQSGFSNRAEPIIDTPQRVHQAPPALRLNCFNDYGANARVNREEQGASARASREDGITTANLENESGSSPSSAESTHTQLFSDKDLLSVLGRPHEYTQGKNQIRRDSYN